ncbi:hypothetical protein Pmani_000003 [Petrolisthes manimaculis]|uniref:Uncharacterized protein n=1 Tax=Petrolisthes manimaculis TaxID=1843537 RepID=A0AAE1QN94_9EUCA|nr:hypothetical protein Pmani_000003 [Petrolisthes manimaculis]
MTLSNFFITSMKGAKKSQAVGITDKKTTDDQVVNPSSGLRRLCVCIKSYNKHNKLTTTVWKEGYCNSFGSAEDW